MGTVLIIDDAEDLRFSLKNVIKNYGFTPLEAETGQRGLHLLKTNIVDLVFLDIGLPDVCGTELIGRIKELNSDCEIVMLTGQNDAKTAVESLKAGAVDYIVKPFELIEFTTILGRIMHASYISKKAYVSEHDEQTTPMICQSAIMGPVKNGIQAASEVKSPVLITGETGTGKELAARAIHNLQKKESVFVKVDCGTLTPNLIESELFGYEKGAFTDALNTKKGLVEIADGGTLFLDEIGNLPLSLQPKLLRLISESTFRKVGGTEDIQVSVRIISATNHDLAVEVEKGNFRQDLFYRLNVIPIELPPLRKRKEDILLLSEYYLQHFNGELKKAVKGFTTQTSTFLQTHSWPGNVRELKNFVEREIIFCRGDRITLSNSSDTPQPSSGQDKLLTLREMEMEHIKMVLEATENNKSQAAKILGITRTTLRTKMKAM